MVVPFDNGRGGSRASNPLELERPALGACSRPLLDVGVLCPLVIDPSLLRASHCLCVCSSLSSCIMSSPSSGTLSWSALGSAKSGR
eukprot:432479-Pyramimonas_sp.AAC.1